MKTNERKACPNPNCEGGRIKGTDAGCCICERPVAIEPAKPKCLFCDGTGALLGAGPDRGNPPCPHCTGQASRHGKGTDDAEYVRDHNGADPDWSTGGYVEVDRQFVAAAHRLARGYLALVAAAAEAVEVMEADPHRATVRARESLLAALAAWDAGEGR